MERTKKKQSSLYAYIVVKLLSQLVESYDLTVSPREIKLTRFKMAF